jgi:hypothetical protein
MANEVKPGMLVGWKFRAALVLGHVKSVEKGGDMLHITPISKPQSTVSRRREKVLLERELDKADIEAAMQRHGHMARTATKTRTPKAQRMGLAQPHQVGARTHAFAQPRSGGAACASGAWEAS